MSRVGCQSSWSGPLLGGLADERVQPSEIAKSLWEPLPEKLSFLFTSIWYAGDGWMVEKVVGDTKAGPSLWVSCCWALRSSPSTVSGALRTCGE